MAKNIFEEIIAENLPNLGKGTATQVQEVQRVPYRINPKRNKPRHIVIKMRKIKDKENITNSKGRATAYKGTPIRLSADFSIETLQTIKEWHDISTVIKGKNLKSTVFYPASLSFRLDGEIESFTDKS